MQIPTVSFVLGLAVLLYLSTFVLLALLRIITGVSVQRVSYSGLRRVAFSPRDGVSVRVRGISISLHRPTFAQPTWVSLKLTEPRIIIDLAALHEGQEADDALGAESGREKAGSRNGANSDRVRMFKQLMRWKERLKRLHRQVEWLRNLDLVMLRSTVTIKDVGSLRMERFTLSVDTRPKTVDRSRLFQHNKSTSDAQRPAEWMSLVRSILLTVEGKESVELLDYCTISVHGFLHRTVEGLRDASIAVKMGRVTVPYDHFESLAEQLRIYKARNTPATGRSRPATPPPKIEMNGHTLVDEDTEDDAEGAVKAISDAREFASSTLRGVQEVQLAVSFFGLSKRIHYLHKAGQHVYFNVAMKEVGLDLMRLDPKSPAHRMYFSHKDTAHQALLTAIAISAGVDDGHEHPERMTYVPMMTATIKTTLPSKIFQAAADTDISSSNSNILFANLVCTSPSVDIDPKHFPLLLAIIKAHTSDDQAPNGRRHRRSKSTIISRLLPKATVKVAIQEPVIRVSLPHRGEEAEYDMIISSVSGITVEVDARHDPHQRHHYALSVNYRHTMHRLYGQTFDGARHELLFADTVEVKIDINAFPQMTVQVTGRWQDFSVFLVQQEICEGLRQIILSLRKELQSSGRTSNPERLSFLRRIPAWLQHLQLEGSDFNIEVSGVEPTVSKYARGISMRLESWSAQYKADREEIFQPVGRRRSTSRASHRDSSPRHDPSDSPRRKNVSPTDGRRLAVHVDGLEGLIIDSVDKSSGEQFLSLPRYEVAFSTTTDAHGAVFHINSKAEKLYLNYSLYNHFAAGVAYVRLRKTFMPSVAETMPSTRYNVREHPRASLDVPNAMEAPNVDSNNPTELTTVDFRAGLVQVKANMPSDPPMMAQLFHLEAGQHRWATPFVRTTLARLYTGTPAMKKVWSRIISVKTLRLDLRNKKRRVNKQVVDEKSFDVAVEAIRLAVPHKLVVHSIFDNITNIIKVNEQLLHQFKTGTNEYVLEKHPEGPKNVPKITFRSQVMIFEIEDSPFEFKLGVIYRSGLLEQRQRLAREEAFRIKAKRMNTRRPSMHATRTRSARPREKEQDLLETPKRARSHSRPHSSNGSPREPRRKLRFDATGVCDLDGQVRRSVDQARDALNRFNAQSWRSRIDRAFSSRRHAIKDIRSFFFGIDAVPEEDEEAESIMGLSLKPGLATLLVSDLNITIDKPSFPLQDLPQFMHDVGKGIPLDMKYSLLIPLHVIISMGEARLILRDYPLPLIHIPAIRSGQSARLPSLALATDFVVAEEYRDKESQRHVDVEVVPRAKLGPDDEQKPYKIVVRRTISPVKSYSNMKIDINTSAPTRIAWGTSYQAAIQDMMQVIEGFTKPPIDRSDRVGFWDKIRLSFHSRITVSWKEDGDVRLLLKGSRDPYIITGEGAGLAMIWRNNVVLRIAVEEDPRKFMTVNSGDYILAVPDYDHYARHALDTQDGSDSAGASQDSTKSLAMFKKVAMKLSGDVQWMCGLVFEQGLEGGRRRFDFKPHWDVVLKHPDYAHSTNGKPFDAFRGFRSQHIHMSMAVSAPHSRDWSAQNVKPSDNYNSVHLTPRFFTHFLKWWSMFSGVMSLPVRQGPLWGSQEKSSKKFGRHLATIKYNLLLSPVFISHMYKHKDVEDFSADAVAVTGLKVKINSFMLDLHQRREYFDIPGNKDARPKRTSSMKIFQGLLDLQHGDFRAVSASIRGTSKTAVDEAGENDLSTFQNSATAIDLSKFSIPDNDFSWIDMDDFVELDWILPQESNPQTEILPLGSTPRFTWNRQTDHEASITGDSLRESPFGDETTHYCVMSHRNDPRRVQADLIQARLDKIAEQIKNNDYAVGEETLNVVRETSDHQKVEDAANTLKEHAEALRSKHAQLDKMLQTLLQRLRDNDAAAVPGLETPEPPLNRSESNWRSLHMEDGDSDIPTADESGVYDNRFVVHNPQIKWNNSLRNIMLRYIHQVGQRRGFVYYMSRRAVKFILDIIEEKKRSSSEQPESFVHSGTIPTDSQSPIMDDELTVEDRIEQILADGRDVVEADDGAHPASQKLAYDPGNETISSEYISQNSYHFRLIAPQIQLQSEKNPKSVLLIAAKDMHLKVNQIMDTERIMDEISGLVQRRFNAAMDSMQVFVASTKTFTNEFLHMYSGNRYGAKAGTYWPPWVPMEVMYEFSSNPYGFARVVQRTSASLRYDKYNNLRLKYSDDVSRGQDDAASNHETPEHRMDHLTVEFPQFRAICDSPQYYAMYVIAMDLLLYSEPLEKTRSERLEKIMLASDFSDLTGTPEMVEMLQARIRQLEEIKMHFQIHEGLLDRQGWKDRISMDHDLTSCEDELFFMMKAITTSQQKSEDRGVQDASSGILNWFITAKELAWHLVRENEQKFLEFQIRDTSFERTDRSDGSNSNKVEFGMINGFNYLPNRIYHELIAPYDEEETANEVRDSKMLRVQWLELEAVAGIPVIETFEVQMIPVRVQLEREVGKKLFEYIFPGKGASAFEGAGLAPFKVGKMIAPHEDGEDPMAQNLPEPKENANDVLSPVSPDGAEKYQGTGTGAGTLEARLKPTLHLDDINRQKPQQKGLGITDTAHGALATHWNLFGHKNKSSTSVNKKAQPVNGTEGKGHTRSVSKDSVNGTGLLKPTAAADRKSTSTTALVNLGRKSAEVARSASRKGKTSSHESDSATRTNGDADEDEADSKPNDDLTQMMNRASVYKTLSYFHVHSLILCLSYKGEGKRNIEDVHELVFRLPAIEYRNQTLSLLDLAMQLKSEMYGVLFRHAGSIIGNKLRGAPKRAKNRAVDVRDSLLLGNGNLSTNGSGLTRSLAGSNGRARSVTESQRGKHEPRSEHSQYRDSVSTSTRDNLDTSRAEEISDDEDSREDLTQEDYAAPGQHENGRNGFNHNGAVGNDSSARHLNESLNGLSSRQSTSGTPKRTSLDIPTSRPHSVRQSSSQIVGGSENATAAAMSSGRANPHNDTAAAAPSINLNGSPMRQNTVSTTAGGDASETRSLKDSIRRLSVLGRRSRSGTNDTGSARSHSPPPPMPDHATHARRRQQQQQQQQQDRTPAPSTTDDRGNAGEDDDDKGNGESSGRQSMSSPLSKSAQLQREDGSLDDASEKRRSRIVGVGKRFLDKFSTP